MTSSVSSSVNGTASPAVAASTEVLPKANRRTFTAAYKQRVLQEADACQQSGQLGALLRREGLYASHLSTWRGQRDQGELGTKKRGKKADPQAQEIARLKRHNARLQTQLAQAELIIGVQKKLCTLFGLPADGTPPAEVK